MNAKKYLVALIASAVLALTAGCAALKQGGTGAQTAVEVATIKVIDGDAERANRVVEIVGKVRGLIEGDEVSTLETVEDNVRSAIDWSGLDTAEKLVVNRLIDAVRAEIDNRINADDIASLDPDEVVAVQRILDWIEQAAVMAGAGSNEHDSQALHREEAVQLGRASPA